MIRFFIRPFSQDRLKAELRTEVPCKPKNVWVQVFVAPFSGGRQTEAMEGLSVIHPRRLANASMRFMAVLSSSKAVA
jgi:hypothetical protein